MTDIISEADGGTRSRGRELGLDSGLRISDSALIEFIELFFFAYRDFVSDPDAILEEFGFGRAHHRVLHFVNRQPGLRVADLLDILKITKQSLAPVLKQLVEKGYVVQRAGSHDRRERLLYPTLEGRALFLQLVSPQMTRIRCALSGSEAMDLDIIEKFLFGMIDPEECEQVRELVGHGALVTEGMGPKDNKAGS